MVFLQRQIFMVLLCGSYGLAPTHDDHIIVKSHPTGKYFHTIHHVSSDGPDQSTSPYYEDPDGRSPPPAPHVNLDDLEIKDDECENEKETEECKGNERLHRTLSGRCNNLHYPEFGAINQPMPRILPSNYHDAYFSSQSVVPGKFLPNPRVISLAIRKLPQAKPTEFNVMVMQLGQFIDHDFVLTPQVKDSEGKAINCKACDSWKHPACAPIPIPPNDPFMQSKDTHTGQRRCLPFTRTNAVPRSNGFGRQSLEQININTGFLDLSTVYGGGEECKEYRLRLFSNGHMAETRVMNFSKGVLPMAPASLFEECRTIHGMCFLSGDDRSNEHLGIMVTHMLFLREHNRIAMELTKINPHWDDEKLFQVAREINIAQYQHMIYNEFVPALVGWYKAEEYGLLPQTNGFSKSYDGRVNPGVLNEFATSAFRLGHTMIPDDFRMLDVNYKPVSSFPLVETFHNTTMIFPMETGDYLLRGLIGTRLRPFDLHVVDVVLDRLFEMLGEPHSGEDLFARNVARGRDHGTAPYTKYRKFCGLGQTTNFDDLRTTMMEDAITVLREVYASVHDIDLYVGGLAEKPLPGAIVGPTFACIVAFQFLNSKRGDRFWYEEQEAGFSYGQLHAIRSSTSLASLICENMAEEVDHRLPIRALRLPCNRKNPLVKCSELRKLDLTLWAEKPVFLSQNCMYMSVAYPPGATVSVSPCLSCVCSRKGKLQCQPFPRGCEYPGLDEYCKLYCRENDYS